MIWKVLLDLLSWQLENVWVFGWYFHVNFNLIPPKKTWPAFLHLKCGVEVSILFCSPLRSHRYTIMYHILVQLTMSASNASKASSQLQQILLSLQHWSDPIKDCKQGRIPSEVWTNSQPPLWFYKSKLLLSWIKWTLPYFTRRMSIRRKKKKQFGIDRARGDVIVCQLDVLIVEGYF